MNYPRRPGITKDPIQPFVVQISKRRFIEQTRVHTAIPGQIADDLFNKLACSRINFSTFSLYCRISSALVYRSASYQQAMGEKTSIIQFSQEILYRLEQMAMFKNNVHDLILLGG